MQRFRFAAMMSRKNHQHNRRTLDEEDARIIGDERLTIAGFVRYKHAAEVFGKAIVDLLLLQGRKHEFAGGFRYQLVLLNHFKQVTDFPRRAVAEVNSCIVDGMAKRGLDLLFRILAKRELDGLVSGGILIARIECSKPNAVPIQV